MEETNNTFEQQFNAKLLKASHRIEELFFRTNGKCYVSFSGGKDSTVLLALIKMSIDSYVLPPKGIKAIFSNTGVELLATIEFVEWCKSSGWYENIEIIKPEKSFAYILKTFGKPMKSKIKSEYIDQWHNGEITESLKRLLIDGKTRSGKRACKTVLADKDMHMVHDDFNILTSSKCCNYLKKKPFRKYEKENNILGVITGLRANEFGARELALKKNKGGDRLCTYVKNGIEFISPLVDWSESDIDFFIEKYNVPLSKAYTQYGLKRTGCVGCPFNPKLKDDLKILYFYEPQKYKMCMFFLKDVYIAQDIKLPFDLIYEEERNIKWQKDYTHMRYEMLEKYRPMSKMLRSKIYKKWKERI